MKKLLNFLLIVPMLLVSMFVLFACSCSDKQISKISLFLNGFEQVNGGYVVDRVNNKSVLLEVDIEPEGYSPLSLQYFSSNTDVASFSRNGEQIFIILNKEGDVEITASYRLANGKEIQGILNLKVLDSTSKISFSNREYVTTYCGEGVEQYYKVMQDNANKNLIYEYFKIDTSSEGGITKTKVENIIDAGKYYITCIDENDKNAFAETFLTVNKAKLNLVAQDYSITYGNDLPEELNSYEDIENKDIASFKNATNVFGLGREKNIKIGSKVEVVDASLGSNSKLYDVNILMKLDDSFKSNYLQDYSVTKGTLKINKLDVVLICRDQDRTYGSFKSNNVKLDFDLYSYEDYLKNGESVINLNPLRNDFVSYTSDISYEVKFLVNGKEATYNSADCLDVLYKANGEEIDSYEAVPQNLTGKNLNILKVINGKVTITKRDVSIIPIKGQKKIYSQKDPAILCDTVNAILNDVPTDCLYINYTKNIASDIINSSSLGEGNASANVGKYYYAIKNTNYKNYNLSLDERALENSASQDKITFEVVPCSLEIKFKSLEELYKTPKDGGTYPSINYYGNEEDYITEIESIKINDEFYNKENWKNYQINEGAIPLKNMGVLKFELMLYKIKNPNFFASYQIKLKGTQFLNDDRGQAYDDNYKLKLIYSTVNLKKTNIIITPTNLEACKKTFDATNNYDLSNLSLNTNLNVSLEEILENPNEIFTLENNGKYYKLNNVNYEETEFVRNVGKYKIFLNENLTFKNGKEHFTFSLDNSQDYYYEILPFEVLITPSTLNKTYGSSDLNFQYNYSPYKKDLLNNEISSSLPETTLNITGKLSRSIGEDAGFYSFNLNDLSFGENYKLILDSSKRFEIFKREVTVTPYNDTYVYGEKYLVPRFSYSINGSYDSSILIEPSFTGSFGLGLENEDGTFNLIESNLAFPVNKYNILQNSFNLDQASLKNYNLSFINTSTITIKKRDLILNLLPKSISSDETLTSANLELNKNYTLSNLISYPENVTASFNVNLSKAENNKYYYVPESEYNKLSLKVNEVFVEDNYNLLVSSNIAFEIGLKVFDFKIVASSDNLSETINEAYNGNVFSDSFKLISNNSEYSINEDSNFIISFIKDGANSTPKDAGSYIVKLEIDETHKLIVDYNDQTFEFTNLSLQTVNNCMINILNSAYLNISKASISLTDTPHFIENFTYKDPSLPKLKTINSSGQPIFTGVKGEQIYLKNYEDTNLNYISYYNLSNLQVSSTPYLIDVTVQAVKENGELNNNYESLTIKNIPLTVEPKQIKISSHEFSNQNSESNFSFVYDGRAKLVNITLTADSQNFVTTYNYFKLKTTYEIETINGEKFSVGKITCYNYDAENKRPSSQRGSLTGTEFCNLEITNFEVISGTRFVLINNDFCVEYINDSHISTIDAGTYVCMPTCVAFNNYTFESNSRISFYKAFEIKKSNEVSFSNWKEEFNYSTQFNFDGNQQSLPFEFKINPEVLKQYVHFTLNGEGPVGSTTLSVGDYSVTLKIDTNNYFYEEEKSFKIIKNKVEFEFPLTNTFVYTSEPITKFLNQIKIIEKNALEDNIYYYDYENEDSFPITLEFYDINNNLLTSPPSAVGSYSLKIIYGSESATDKNNHYGEGTFNYSIINNKFSASVSVQNTTISYSPLWTNEYVYNNIILKMLKVFSNEDYEVKAYLGEITENNLITATSKFINKLKIGENKINFEVEFLSSQKKVSENGILTINKLTINSSNFNTNNKSSYVYNGYNINHFTSFVINGVKIPLNFDDVNAPFESNGYSYTKEITTISKIKYIKILDNLSNEVIKFRYIYKNNGEELENSPVEPGNDYSVEYEITCGDKYSSLLTNNISYSFKITKINNLTIFIKPINLVYNNTNFITSLSLDDYLLVKNEEGSDTSNVNFTFSSSYNKNNGVYLKSFWTDINGKVVSEVRNAGEYKLNVSLLCAEGYTLSKYFNNITINIEENFVTKSISEMIQVEGEDYFNILSSRTVIIKKADSKYNINNYSKAFDFTGYNQDNASVETVTDSEGSRIVIKINSIENFNINVMAKENLQFKLFYWLNSSWSGNNNLYDEYGLKLSANENEKTYGIIIQGDDNYKDSAQIIIKLVRETT